MPPPNPLPAALLSLRMDALGFVAMALCATWLIRRRLQNEYPSSPFPFRNLLAVVLVILLAAATAEVALATASSPTRAAVARGAVFLIAAVAIWIVLLQAGQLVRMQARLRSHVIAARRLEAARRSAEQANRAKSEFLVHMTHEIRTPLNAMLASAESLFRCASEPAQRMHSSSIVNEGLRLGSVLNEVLDLRRIEEGRLVLERVPFFPGDIAREVVQLFAAQAERKGIEVRVETNLPPRFTITGDPRRFRQVLTDLVDNAIRFTKQGPIAAVLNYSRPSADRALLHVRVRDPERLLTAAQLEAVLHSTDPEVAFSPSGTGGLGLSQRIVSLMGSTISGASEPGKGTELSFTLAVEPTPEPMPAPAATVARAGYRILVVDDMEANRVMLEMYLDQHGFEADHAGGGAEAIELAARNRYDAILMDINMPGIDGYAAARRIRAAERPAARTLIVAVTAYIGDDVRERCLASGMDEYFAKPLELRKFCRTLKHLIALRRGESVEDMPAVPIAAVTESAGLPVWRTG